MTVKSELRRRLPWQEQAFVRIWVEQLVYRLVGAENDMNLDECAKGAQEGYHGDMEQLVNAVVAEGCRLGALLLLSKIRRRFYANLPPNTAKQRKVVFTGYETDRLAFLLEQYGERWTNMKPLQLWAAVLGALEVDDQHGLEAFRRAIKKTATELDQSWSEIFTSVSNLLWVGEVLDDEYEQLSKSVDLDT